MTPTLTLTDAPDAAHRDLLGDGLNRYNDALLGFNDRRPLAVLAQDPATGATIGGISGRTSLGVLFIDLVYLPESLRGQDVGSDMLAMAEAEGRRRGCRWATLFTISFQAPGFYEKRGWTRFGEVPCEPPGTSRVFMRKELA